MKEIKLSDLVLLAESCKYIDSRICGADPEVIRTWINHLTDEQLSQFFSKMQTICLLARSFNNLTIPLSAAISISKS